MIIPLIVVYFCFLSQTQDRRKLLRQWVESNQNASAIEAQICLMKSQGTTLTCDRELLTVGEMAQRGLPPQKIQAIVSKGNGVPDPDLPGDVSLMKFWVSTATKKTDKEEVNIETKMQVQAQASGATVDGFFDTNALGPQGAGSMGATNMQDLINTVNQAGQHVSKIIHQGIYVPLGGLCK